MATIRDVAQRAGVSMSTVSYALNGNRPISDETRSRIQAAVDELGYQRNAAARALASRRSHVIALVVPPVSGGMGATIGEFVEAATAEAEDNGYALMIWPFANREYAKVDHFVQARLADGVLVMEVTLDDPRIAVLEAAKVPFTMIGRTRDTTGQSWVDIDFEQSTAMVIDRLAELGHRHIALINHSPAMLDDLYGPAVRTRDAFRAGTAARGMLGIDFPCDESAISGRQVVSEILTRDPATTALITLNETATFGVMSELHDRGLSVPGDVSVVGLATSPAVATMSTPRLSAWNVPGQALGRTAVQELLEVIDEQQRRDRARLFLCEFTEGETIASAVERSK